MTSQNVANMVRCYGSVAHLAVLMAMCAGVANSSFLQRRQNPRASYRQALHNFQNVQYYADFEIGGQQIAGIFDTGSFELLVRSSRCAHCAHPTAPYDHLKSRSYAKNGTVTKHVFGSGPCISMMGYETVSVGNLKSSKQAFWEIIDHRIGVLDTAKFAAIVGIGPNFAFGNKEKTLLMSYGVEEFSVCLKKESGSEGFLNWGPEAKQMAPEHRATAKVIGKHHWVTRLSNVKFTQPENSKKAIQVPCSAGSQGCAAIIDSGTSLIAAPGSALMQLSEQIPPIKEDCSNLHELPPLNFVIDGHDFVLPPQAYVMRVTGAVMEANDVWDILFFKPKMRKLNMCMPAFMQIDMMSRHGPIWILGMPFFRYFHTTFDRKSKEMHFTVAGPECESLPFNTSRTSAFIAERTVTHAPLDVDVDAIVPPTLSGMMDFPFANAGELDL
mmetsp:Transcript_72588/g.125997  ORF Transcript_72588/g.125997 Transcript_72588/m.125997 type:complete len:441 (-) Transcript_72588:61-1383(-)